MFPNWHDDIAIPTVGDDIIIGQTVTVSPVTNIESDFRIAVQPKSSDGVLSKHAKSIAALIRSTHASTAKLLDSYSRSTPDSLRLDELKVNLKNVLENQRSSLEYIAHYMAEVCTTKPKSNKVQFPVANETDTEITFSQKVDRWFPGLDVQRPKVKDYIISIQHFTGELWLRKLANLTNFNKHRNLSSQEMGEFKSVVISFGDAGLRLGDLGFKSVRLEPGGVIRFKDSNGKQAEIETPGFFDLNSVPIDIIRDHRIKVTQEVRNMYFIPGYTESIAHTIWLISKNVYRTVNTICSLLS
ncbi:hypothetical protein ACFL3Q_11035 [Planctomycetota bacterium]